MRLVSAMASLVAAMCLFAVLAGCGVSPGPQGAAKVTATATSAPPAATTPTATPTAFEKHLDAIAEPAIGTLAYNVSVRFDQAGEAAAVTATVKRAADVPTTQELVKTVSFRALRALWTSGESFKDVSVAVLGPFQDDFGDQVIQAYGSADVTAGTAATLNWATLTPDAAWNAYSAVFLAPSFASGQYWGLPTPTPFATGNLTAARTA